MLAWWHSLVSQQERLRQIDLWGLLVNQHHLTSEPRVVRGPIQKSSEPYLRNSPGDGSLTYTHTDKWRTWPDTLTHRQTETKTSLKRKVKVMCAGLWISMSNPLIPRILKLFYLKERNLSLGAIKFSLGFLAWDIYHRLLKKSQDLRQTVSFWDIVVRLSFTFL